MPLAETAVTLVYQCLTMRPEQLALDVSDSQCLFTFTRQLDLTRLHASKERASHPPQLCLVQCCTADIQARSAVLVTHKSNHLQLPACLPAS